MFTFLLKRILWFIPTLLVISWLAFGLSRCTPGDPVDNYLASVEEGGGAMSREQYRAAYAAVARKLNLDLPFFYFSLAPRALPDTLYRVLNPDERAALRALTLRYGNWTAVSEYYAQVTEGLDRARELARTTRTDASVALRSVWSQLPVTGRTSAIQHRLDTLAMLVTNDSLLRAEMAAPLAGLQRAFENLDERAASSGLYLPAFHWYGLDNQYHRWLMGVLGGDFGFSYRDQLPVTDKIRRAVRWTVVMNVIAIILAYCIAIPIGVYSAVRRGRRFDRWATVGLFVLYSVPNFWLATLLTIFLATPEYGLDWFPSQGVGEVSADAGWWESLWIRAEHLILPIFCLTYNSLAYIAQQARAGMLKVLDQDYIRTAWAKGLPPARIIWKHGFRNALFPLITLFAGVFPAALAGSVVIEVIFNIPGMGALTVDSIVSRDWPVVYTILLIAAVLTVVGILVADILYKVADPRVTYGRR